MRKWILILGTVLTVASCQVADTLVDTATELFRGEVVAKVGDHKLHRSELKDYIPKGVSPEDSVNLSRQYIEAWAQDLLMLDMAEEQLSDEEKDVSRELEDYRRTLLKYRYEQRYIEQRLDTLVTDEEIAAFYQAHPEKVKLDRPILKARYLLIPADSKNLKTLRRLISSEDEADVMEAANLAATAAVKFTDLADVWTDAFTLAQDMGIDYQTLQSSLHARFVEYTDESGLLHLAYLAETVPAGKTAPLEYCTNHIRDLILSGRKHALESSLERDLLEDARDNKKFVIY